jgi:hypothetical protein
MNNMALYLSSDDKIINDNNFRIQISNTEVPFPGVKSFKVLTDKVNYFTEGQATCEIDTTGFLTSSHNVQSGSTISITTDEKYQGSGCLKVVTNTTNAYEGVDIRYDDVNISGYVTFSVYIKAPAGLHMRIVTRDYANQEYTSPDLVHWYASGNWERHHITFYLSQESRTIDCQITVYNSKGNYTFYVDSAQLELSQKPTLFVNPAWSGGVISLSTVDRDFNHKVVSTWFKLFSGHNNPYPRIFDMGDGTTTSAQGWEFHYDYANSRFQFYVGNSAANLSISSVENIWFFVVLIFNSGTYKIVLYKYGTGKIWNYSFSSTMPDLSKNVFKIGNTGEASKYARALNGWISNILISEYDPNIWTDSYIEKIYNSKTPWRTPKKTMMV